MVLTTLVLGNKCGASFRLARQGWFFYLYCSFPLQLISKKSHLFVDVILQRLVIPQVGWHGTPGASAGLILKKTQRIDIPIDKYPNV